MSNEALTPRSRLQNFSASSLLAFILLGAIWGSAFTFIRLAVDHFPPFTLVALRMLCASVFMVPALLIYMYIKPELRQHVKEEFGFKTQMHLAFMGMFNNAIPFVLVAYAEMSINSGLASVIDSTIPLFGLIFAHIFLPNDRITKAKAFGLTIGFAGVVLVCLQDILQGPIEIDHVWGYVMVTLASAAYGIASVYARKFLYKKESFPLATFQMLWAALYCVIGSVTIDYFLPIEPFAPHFEFFKNVDMMSILSIVYLGVLSSNVAYLLYFYLIRTVGSVKQTMVGYLLPVFGILDGAVFLHELAHTKYYWIIAEVCGALLVVGGIGVVSTKKQEPAPASHSVVYQVIKEQDFKIDDHADEENAHHVKFFMPRSSSSEKSPLLSVNSAK